MTQIRASISPHLRGFRSDQEGVLDDRAGTFSRQLRRWSHRRAKRFLSPSQKYEIWIGLLRGEYTMAEAAERAGVDRSTIMKLRAVAKQGALDAPACLPRFVALSGLRWPTSA